jgi:hypothetical protein
MDLLPIPRAALAQLLRDAGSPLTPEQYLASLPTMNIVKKYESRANASAWSKWVLAIAAVISVLFVPFSISFENILVAAGLCAVTYFEFRVNQGFREGHPGAPDLGFRNQSFFAIGILVYGLYHAFFAGKMDVPAEYRELIDSQTLATVEAVTKVGYVAIGIVGGVSQFCLAWYYRSAKG